MSSNTTALLNPLTPLAFLTPEVGDQVQIGNYVVVGTLAAFIWDVLCNSFNDYRLVSQYRVGIGTWAYFAARFCTLFYLIASTLYLTYPLGKCVLARKFYEVGCAIAVPTNTLLIFLRARAIFNNNKYLVLLFFLLWLTVAGTAIMPAIPGMITAANIGPTKYCTTKSDKSFTGLFTIAPPIHDTVVFVAISWRMFQTSHLGDSNGSRRRRDTIKAAITGEYLPRFSKAVLKDGQMYYLITVIANLPSALMSFNTHVTATYRTMFFVCTVMVTNCMASFVFRNTKFGYHEKVLTTTELKSRTVHSTPIFNLSGRRRDLGDSSAFPMPVVVIDTVVARDVEQDARSAELSNQKICAKI